MIDTVEEWCRPAEGHGVVRARRRRARIACGTSPPRPGPSLQRSVVPVPVMPVTATVQVGPVPETAATSGLPTVLVAKLTSAPANPDTVSLNTTVKLIGLALVGST